MSIKSILALYNGQSTDLPVLDRALAFAHAAHADVRVVYFCAPPVLPDLSGGGIYNGLGFADTTTLDILDAQTLAEGDRIMAQVQAHGTRFGVPYHNPAEVKPVGQAMVSSRTIAGNPRQCLSAQACTVDLMMTGYDTRQSGDMDMVLAGVFSADCPILAVPRRGSVTPPANGYAKTVVVAWDGSRSSARALRAAVPHMLRAEDVYILHVAAAGMPLATDVKADLVAYLRSHSIVADFVTVQKSGKRIGASLLEEGARLGADLLAMGAYGHNRIGELLLGGVTDHVLKHADIPLLLAH